MSRRQPDTARLFFALDPDAATREAIHARQRLLALPGRPVPASRLHATLAFLGSTPRGRLDELRRVAAAIDFPPVAVQLDRVGTFARAGIAWLGTNRPPPELASFRAQLAAALTAAGYAIDDKPWILHVTLYRELRTRPRRMHIDPVDWAISRYVLMESVDGPEGLRYRVRGHWPEPPVRGRREPV